MRGKPTRGWRKIQTLHDLANDGYTQMGSIKQKGMETQGKDVKTCSTAEDYS